MTSSSNEKIFTFFLDERKIYKISVIEKSIEIGESPCYDCKSPVKSLSFRSIVYDKNLTREIVCDDCWVCFDRGGECMCKETNKEDYLLCKINNDENLKDRTRCDTNENEWQFLHYFLYEDGKEYFSQLLLK